MPTNNAENMIPDGRYLVIYDGVCNFCNGAVNFIVKRDHAERFVFSPMQTDFAQEMIKRYAIETVGKDTFLLIKNGHAYVWSNAALEISKDLSGIWSWCNFFRIIPRPFRDFIYRIFARNRIRLFGRTEQCVVPDQSLRKRFIGL